jgi:hypothetical protein
MAAPKCFISQGSFPDAPSLKVSGEISIARAREIIGRFRGRLDAAKPANSFGYFARQIGSEQ